MKPNTHRTHAKGAPFPTHIALKRDEHDRLKAYGAKLGAQLSPRQVVLYLLTRAERGEL